VSEVTDQLGPPPQFRGMERPVAVLRGAHGALLGLFLFPGPVVAQLPHRTDTDTLWCDTTLRHAFAHGTIDGHFRLFAMGTVNSGALTDHHAAAFGGTLGYRSARWHGLRFSLMGGYTMPLFASAINGADDPALQPSRYEIGLFDATGHEQGEYLYLHEFNIDFRTRDRRWQFTLGKQHLDDPFLNGQDSRMHPTLFDGVTVQRRGRKGARYEVLWIHHVAPRSTAHWYSAAQSIGVYPGQGRDAAGRPSGYAGMLHSAGVFSTLGEWEPAARFHVIAHDLFVEDIINTAFLEVSYRTTGSWSVQFRAMRQDAVGNGGHAVDSLRYVQPGTASHIATTRVQYARGPWTFQLNGTRITAQGRFIMPREWGREPLFTYLSRERNEGLGDVWAATLHTERRSERVKGFTTHAGAGLFGLPPPSSARLNKYNMVSYGHAMLDLRYAFQGMFQGLDLRLLYVHKWPLQREDLTSAHVYNRVDMHHASLVVDYRF
jgi:hypothetical protein